jgi:hypothetical protein
VTNEQVEEWLKSSDGESCAKEICESTDKMFPIRVPLVPGSGDEEPVGYILVGPRPDGSIPSKDEHKALAGVSEPIARAVRNVIRREARERQVVELIEANAQRIAELEALLAGNHASPRKGAQGPA